MASPRTLLGPLTTTWEAPPICTYGMALCETCTTVWQGQTCNPSRRAHDWTDCWPPRTSGAADPGVMMGWGFYSPGVACPSGFTTAALATAGGNSAWPVQFSMEAGETAVACCLSGFSITSVIAEGTTAQTCMLVATTSSFSTVQCDSGSFANFALVTLGPSRPTYTIYAPLFQLNYRATDRPGNPSEVMPPSTHGSSGPSQTSGSDSGMGGGGGGGSTTGDEGGLSLGAKVGIGVGSALLAVFLSVVTALVWRASRRRRASRLPPLGEALPDEKKPIPAQPELGGVEIRELEAQSKPQELEGSLPPPRSSYTGSYAGSTTAGGGGPGAGIAPVYELQGSPASSVGPSSGRKWVAGT